MMVHGSGLPKLRRVSWPMFPVRRLRGRIEMPRRCQIAAERTGLNTRASRPGGSVRPSGNARTTARSAATEELATVYAALDNIENGVILLDRELRLQYANPASHAMFKSPQKFVEGKPLFAEMLEHARRSSAYAVSADELKQYVARRLAWVSSGDPTPVDQHLSSGRVIRCQCAVLPGGGRMLTYSDVTDIVRHAEELERLATTDGMTGIYNRRHFMTLADHEWNRSRRYGRPAVVPDDRHRLFQIDQ